MTKALISNYLEKFDYKYIEHEKVFIVKLDFSLQVIIDLRESDKIKISDQLQWNSLLTWPFSMSIKGSMIYNLIGFLVCTILFMFLVNEFNPYTLIIIYLGAVFWNLNWLIYYLNKAENFKKQIIDLTR